MKKFIFVLSLALGALVANESKASAYYMPSYGNGYGSSSSIGYGQPIVKVTVNYGYPAYSYGGYGGFGGGCYTGCGAYQPYPYYGGYYPQPYPYYGGGMHGARYSSWGFGFRIGRFAFGFRYAGWSKPKYGHYARHWSKYPHYY